MHNRVLDDLDLVDAGRIQHERALDADVVRDAPDGELGVDAATIPANHNAFEDLDALFVALDDLGMHTNGVARFEGRHILAKLGRFDRLNQNAHGTLDLPLGFLDTLRSSIPPHAPARK